MEKKLYKLLSPYSAFKCSRDLYEEKLLRVKSGYLLGHQKNKIHDMRFQSANDWTLLRNSPPPVQWHFHTLGRGCGLLLSRSDKYPAVFDILKNVVEVWNDANSSSNNFESAEQAWSGHTVALRLDFLIGFYIAADDHHKQFLAPIIQRHADFLIKDENHDGNWNHGLDQSIALLKYSYVFEDKYASEISLGRISENFYACFDDEGVNVEQSIMYHNYNVERFLYAADLLACIGVDFDLDTLGFKSVLRKAREFLCHSIDPDGMYAMFGDTIYSKPVFLHKSQEVEYLASGGVSGLKPEYPNKKVYKSGFLYGRSSWDLNENPLYYAIRFGPARIIHGHNDHMSIVFYKNRELILCDGGFNGYGNNEYRAYFRSPQAHNVVFSDQFNRFNWDALTELVFSYNSEILDYHVFQDRPYKNVIRTRSVAIDLINGALMVLDFIESLEDTSFIQSWTFNPDFSASLAPEVCELRSNNNSLDFHLFDSDKLNLFKSSFELDSGRLSIRGGVVGLGHNVIKDCFTLQSRKKGKKLSWVSFLCESSSSVSMPNPGVVLCDDKVYSLSDKPSDFYAEVYSIGRDVCVEEFDTKVSSSADYSGNNTFHIKNSCNEKEFYVVSLVPKVLEDGMLTFSVDFDEVMGLAPTYFYASCQEGKLRPQKIYLWSNLQSGLTIKIPVDPSTIVRFRLRFKFCSLIESSRESI